jgi:inhibitor of KinA sporulation pathway (predicted exonuclease)
MNFSGIFREFLNTKTHKISQFFNKNSKQLSRKYHTFFQDSTYENITKMLEKMSRTHRKRFRNFCEEIGLVRV